MTTFLIAFFSVSRRFSVKTAIFFPAIVTRGFAVAVPTIFPINETAPGIALTTLEFNFGCNVSKTLLSISSRDFAPKRLTYTTVYFSQSVNQSLTSFRFPPRYRLIKYVLPDPQQPVINTA